MKYFLFVLLFSLIGCSIADLSPEHIEVIENVAGATAPLTGGFPVAKVLVGAVLAAMGVGVAREVKKTGGKK